MNKQIRKWFRIYIATFIGIVVLFLATRVYHIQGKYLPIFIDEATYVQWAQVGKFDASQRLISLTDGLEPMFIWLTIAVMKWVSSPLVAGRLVSVFSGGAILAGLYFLTKELYQNRWTAIVSILLYTVFPFALILDRMAIYVSLFGAFFIWSVYFSLVLPRYLKTESAFMLGLVLGGGLLTKISGFLSIYLLPLGLLFFKFTNKQNARRLVKFVLLSVLAVILAMIYYSVLRLSPQFPFLREKSNRFLYSWTDIFKLDLFQVIANNVVKASQWLVTYFSWPWVILIVLSFFSKGRRKEMLFLWLWFLLPFLVLVSLGRAIYPRYLFFMSLPLLPIIAETLTQVLRKAQKPAVAGGIICLSLVFVGFADYKILTDFARAPIPELDLYQYVNGWPAGGGINEIVKYLQKESEKGVIFVFSEGVYGSLPKTAMDIYFRDNANVKHSGIAELSEKIPAEILSSAQTAPTYVILNQAQKPPPWPMVLVAQYQKGISQWYIRLYRVKAASER